MQPRLLEIRKGVLDKNDQLARRLRDRFSSAHTLAINLVSSPGSGKTLLLEKTLASLRSTGYRAAALVGDLQTDNDARRLAASGVPVRQITTAGNCHLEAQMIEDHLEGWTLNDLEFLFIENVGNLVCPSSYDLGEHLRVVILSVTEGEDKPLKYPPIFHSSDLAIITKIDLAEAVEFNRVAALANIRAVRPDMPILEVSAKTGAGMAEWLRFLLVQRAAALMAIEN
ncbi:MAG: hydrogenase nickel incorporation protein HypB [Anaerolineae bacterium]|nr:hydrogenase nickel incorporation protein HypB [Anaerolineae bacterium]NUQ04147.1 hydrogenase nickel incorporation protein HypB [Anaerolineae bacterium]